MHVISEKPLRVFWAIHPDAKGPLSSWYRIASHAEWRTFAEVRADYSTADQVGKFTVFNIGGNKYRLIVAIHHNRGKLYVRHVLTHSEYDKGKWKEEPATENQAKKERPKNGKSPPRQRPPRR